VAAALLPSLVSPQDSRSGRRPLRADPVLDDEGHERRTVALAHADVEPDEALTEADRDPPLGTAGDTRCSGVADDHAPAAEELEDMTDHRLDLRPTLHRQATCEQRAVRSAQDRLHREITPESRLLRPGAGGRRVDAVDAEAGPLGRDAGVGEDEVAAADDDRQLADHPAEAAGRTERAPHGRATRNVIDRPCFEARLDRKHRPAARIIGHEPDVGPPHPLRPELALGLGREREILARRAIRLVAEGGHHLVVTEQDVDGATHGGRLGLQPHQQLESPARSVAAVEDVTQLNQLRVTAGPAEISIHQPQTA